MTQFEKRKSELSKEERELTKDKHFAYRFFYLGNDIIDFDYRGRGQTWSIPKYLKNSEYKDKEINTIFVYNCD